MNQKILCSIFMILVPVGLYSNTDLKTISEIRKLDQTAPEIKNLKKNIAMNLKETAKSGRLARPIYFVSYRLKKNEHFYLVMAKMSQNMDTLSTLNKLPHPGAVGPGDVMVIPSARGIFVEGKSLSDVSAKYKSNENRFINISEKRWFLPGGILADGEIRIFRGNGFLQPLRNHRVTSRYGYRVDPFSKRSTFHGGIDLGAPGGAPVFASRDGTVIRAGKAGGYGNLIVISHQYGYTTYYGHLSKILVKKGQKVKSGEKVGLVGSTGKANGPHLHFEVRKGGKQKNPRFVHMDVSAYRN